MLPTSAFGSHECFLHHLFLNEKYLGRQRGLLQLHHPFFLVLVQCCVAVEQSSYITLPRYFNGIPFFSTFRIHRFSSWLLIDPEVLNVLRFKPAAVLAVHLAQVLKPSSPGSLRDIAFQHLQSLLGPKTPH